jgi:hypothetical protein
MSSDQTNNNPGLIALSLTENKYQGTLRYLMKKEAADLSRIVLKLIRNSVSVPAWKFGMRKGQE